MSASASLFAVDASLPPSAPLLRREVKFALPETDAGKFRSILDVNARRVRYRRATSRVCSVYFDDAALSACYANLDGDPRRSKTRIRWYDDPFPRGRFFFEVKRREENGIGKERVPIVLDARLEETAFADVVSGLADVLPDPLRELLMVRAEPKVMIEYERAYYEAADAPLRITVDENLVFWRQDGSRFPRRRFAVRVPGLTILEAKAPIGEEEGIPRLLQPLEPWVTRSSKYVIACQALGFLPGEHFAPT